MLPKKKQRKKYRVTLVLLSLNLAHDIESFIDMLIKRLDVVPAHHVDDDGEGHDAFDFGHINAPYVVGVSL